MTASDKSKDLRDLLWKFRVWDDLTDAQHVELEQWLTAHTAAAVEEYKKAVGLKQQEINAEAQARKASL